MILIAQDGSYSAFPAPTLISIQRPTRNRFFFNHTATTEIYTLSLHDALPISEHTLQAAAAVVGEAARLQAHLVGQVVFGDRKSTRLNSSHVSISYAVLCV